MFNFLKRKRKPSLTRIEDALFRGQNHAHAVTQLVLLNDTIQIELSPWIESQGEMVPDNKLRVKATFNKVNIQSRESYEDDSSYPLDIIGFESDPVSENRWTFCLHTDCIEYVFESNWPEIDFEENG